MNSSLDRPDRLSAARNFRILAVYTAAIFVSALLLFSVQPLFTKMVLPRLGGRVLGLQPYRGGLLIGVDCADDDRRRMQVDILAVLERDRVAPGGQRGRPRPGRASRALVDRAPRTDGRR